ncbi:MAG: permease-like cell division protein FtsX [Nitrospiraceae bacterium]|nr:permease-like cell division protein FtsX [Nitrospiraceae bacterium]
MSHPWASALAGIRKEKWINLLSVLSIGVGLFVLLVALIAVYNLDYFASKLQGRFSMTVYLQDGIPAADLAALRTAIRSDAAVGRVSYISKAEALSDLKKALKDSPYLFEGLDGNPLPASLDIRLRRGFASDDAVSGLASRIKQMRGVADVQYGAGFLDAIESVMSGARTAGLAFLAALLGGTLFICYSTVKILFYRRREEIETLGLLGATPRFIRAPFLIEGSLLGAAGGILASLAGYSIFGVFLARFAGALPVFRYVLTPAYFFLLLPAAGLFIGFSGALIALGRIKS